MIRKVLASALLSGLLAGVLVTVIQEFTTTPIILHAEEFEGAGEGIAFLDELYEGGSFFLAHGDEDHGDGAWAPEDGLERSFYTLLTNLLTGVAFALLLVAGFVLYGITLGFQIWLIRAHQGDQPWATRLVDHHGATIAFTIRRLKWVNLYWGLFNLLPVFPLDGGRICYEVLDAGRSRTGLKRTHLIGMITGTAAALFFVNNENFFAGLMFGGIAYDNYRRYERFSSL